MKNAALLGLLGLTLTLGCADAPTDDGAPVDHPAGFAAPLIVGAVPAVHTDSGWVRACSGQAATGWVVDLALISRGQASAAGGIEALPDGDRDLSVQPGELVASSPVTPEADGALELSLGCVEPRPSDDPAVAGCQGDDPGFEQAETRYLRYAQRGAGVDVLLLIDQSGSNSGLVNDDAADVEARPGAFTVPGDFGRLASDPSNLRLHAAEQLIESLNEGDRFAALAFGEKIGFRVPSAQAQGDEGDLALSFGTERSQWLGGDGLSGLIGQAEGRSNLWAAVLRAYDFLATHAEAGRAQHIIILDDGPDTCAAGPDQGGGPTCSEVGSEVLLQRLADDHADPAGARIQIHVVQWQAPGYLERDPAQVEAACLSGGHYIFINSQDFPPLQTQPFQEAFEASVQRIRYSLAGYWQIGGGASGAAGLSGLQVLSGSLRVTPASGLTSSTPGVDLPFGYGQGADADAATSWDRGPTVWLGEPE